MAITVTENTVVKIIVRRGLDSDRQTVTFAQGELGFATDTNRLIVGDGITLGGLSVGTRNYGTATRGSITSPLSGDITYDGGLYSYYNGAWQPTIVPDNVTIKQVNGIWSAVSGSSGGDAYVNTLVHSASGNWNTAYNTLTGLPENAILANTAATNGAGTLLVNPGQFVGNTTGTPGLTAVTLSAGAGITLTPTSNIFTIDASQVLSQLNQFTTALATATGAVASIGTTFYNETSFVYSADTKGGTSGITNMWQNIFVNQSLDFLRITVPNNSSQPQTVRVNGSVYMRHISTPTTAWVRLATFSSVSGTPAQQTSWYNVNGTFPLLNTPYIAYTPATSAIQVLDVATREGNGVSSHGSQLIVDSIYTIPANTTVVFGLQTFLYASRGNPHSWIEINGWQTHAPGSPASQVGPRNALGFYSTSKGVNAVPTQYPPYKGIYAWGYDPNIQNGVALYNGAPGSTTYAPQTDVGIHNEGGGIGAANMFGSESYIIGYNGSSPIYDASKTVKNISYIRATFI
jgi:Major tropism determinant N-terminal domain